MKKVCPFEYNIDNDEIFLPVPEKYIPGLIPNTYEVSNYGRVFNNKTGNFIGSLDQDGYFRSVLRTDNGYVQKGNHTLMMLAFNPPTTYDPKIDIPNHLDGIKYHNTLDNLEWTDLIGNARHAIENNLHKMYGEENPNNKLTEFQVREICELIQSGKYFDIEIAEMYNVSYANISDIHKGKIWNKISKDYDLSKRKLKGKGITRDQAIKICELLEENKYNISQIADMVGTSNGVIFSIIDHKCWIDVSKDYNINKNFSKKFTENTIREICKLLKENKYNYQELANMFNTTKTFISNLKNKHTRWNYIVDEFNL